MKQKNTAIGMIVLIAILVLGVGYAAVTAINLSISGSATASSTSTDFAVKFSETTSKTGGVSDATVSNDTTATITATLNSATAGTATFTVQNNSAELGANVTPTVSATDTNCTSYFNITVSPSAVQTVAAGSSKAFTVSIARKKVPTSDKTCTFTVTLNAVPVES